MSACAEQSGLFDEMEQTLQKVRVSTDADEKRALLRILRILIGKADQRVDLRDVVSES